MPVQNETRFVLRTIKDNWPAETFPSNIRRIDRDTPEVLETGRRQRSVELTDNVVVSAGRAGVERTPFGTDFGYEIQTEIDVRIMAAHESEFGQIADATEFDGLVAKVLRALNAVREYPSVDPDADSLGRVDYLDLRIVSESRQSADLADQFRAELTAELRGRKSLP